MWNSKTPEQQYLEKYPNATLKEYLDYQKQKKEDEYKDIIKIKENHKQWVIDNLVGKYIMFRYESNYRIVKISLDNYNNIKAETLYHFAPKDVNQLNAGFVEDIYRIHCNTSGINSFNIDWVKSPFDVSKYSGFSAKRFNAYVISDEKFNEIASKIKEFTNYYNELTDFEKSDWATKIE